ncbi:MAG: DEAD/DEAH box helicase, partial [Candidatus Aenigmarchaeota archaeon]|nr:DEAD/DEAH box helicase [Candidatus Aenigmarchaeota archaeon]
MKDIPEEAVKILMGNFTYFNPVQKAALDKGLLDGNNLVVAAPTASGKTLIAEMALLRNFYKGGKTIYLCPLRALAWEKYEDFQKYKQLGLKIAVSTGDYDKVEKFSGYDLIILSNEKADSLLRHNVLPNISLIVADEIHLINDVGRGPTLEVVLTRLMEAKPHILALSATISNAEEIAEWLGAKLVKSDYRPIKLEKGTLYPDDGGHTLEIENEKESIENSGDSDLVFVNNILGEKQALIFVSTRRSAEATAEKIKIRKDDELNKIADEIESALAVPTKQCKRLANCVRQGTAFHHAGLVIKQRKLIEDAFKEGKIKILTATPTLAMGMNLPAHTVLIRDTKRYDSEFGSGYLPVLEVQQMCVPYNSQILMHDGSQMQIGDLVEKGGSNVLTLEERTFNIKQNKILKKFKREADTFIKIKAAGRELLATPEHPVLISRNKPIWKPLNEVKKGDLIGMASKISLNTKPAYFLDFLNENLYVKNGDAKPILKHLINKSELTQKKISQIANIPYKTMKAYC